MTHSFEVGGRCRNRKGEYEVISLNGSRMVIRYSNGEKIETTVELQERIRRNIQEEEELERSQSKREPKAIGGIRRSRLRAISDVNMRWQQLKQGGQAVWEKLSTKARIMCVYRAAREGVALPVESTSEENTLVKCALILLLAKASAKERQTVFRSAHTLFQDYVVAQAWCSTDPLDLAPLLPGCAPQVVRYCEARPWSTNEERESEISRVSRAYCPRARKPCGVLGQGNRRPYALQGARLYAVRSRGWKDWSLLELLEEVGVEPDLAGLQSAGEYVTRLSGWVNRLNEIRERLKCSVCGQIMTPNSRYARNLAAYNATVFSCQAGSDHDNDIYLSHCWGCRRIIDSRESQIQIEGYYLCVYCGSGPLESNDYTQGDICPKCGTPDMATGSYDRGRTCRACHHSIQLPPTHKLTGRAEKPAG